MHIMVFTEWFPFPSLPSEENTHHQPFGKNKHISAMWTKPPPEVSCVSYAQRSFRPGKVEQMSDGNPIDIEVNTSRYTFLIVRGCRVGDVLKHDLPWWKSSLSLKIKPLLWTISSMLVWDAEAKSSVFGLEPHNHHSYHLRDHHGICLGYICQICDLPLINTVDGSQIRRSPVEFGTLSQYLPWVLYIPGGCFEFLPSTINQRKQCKKNKAIPEKKHVELYIPKLVQNIPTVEFCWKSTKSFPNFQVKKVTQVKVYPNAPNAPGTST